MGSAHAGPIAFVIKTLKMILTTVELSLLAKRTFP